MEIKFEFIQTVSEVEAVQLNRLVLFSLRHSFGMFKMGAMPDIF